MAHHLYLSSVRSRRERGYENSTRDGDQIKEVEANIGTRGVYPEEPVKKQIIHQKECAHWNIY